MITKDTKLPSDDELNVNEINLSTCYLKAGSFHLGKKCEVLNNEYMLCKKEENDPRKCLKEGKAVTSCAMSFFQSVKANCGDEFEDYGRCLAEAGGGLELKLCRKPQAAFDTCMKEKLCLERPPYGYFTEVRIHESARAKPLPPPPPVYPEALPAIDTSEFDKYKHPQNRHGSRAYFYM